MIPEPWIRDLLRCPGCRAPLADRSDHLACTACGTRYPLADGQPVLVHPQRSVFDPAALAAAGVQPERRGLGRFLPPLSRNVAARANYRQLAEELARLRPDPRLLVVGGGVAGEGFAGLAACPGIRLIETDIIPTPRTCLACDGHDLPFADASVEGVVIQAVLGHVPDPARCVAEIHRVLVPGGLVYAETAFLQQVCIGRHDFARFTDLGHRRLFSTFSILGSGACCGPGMSLAWAWEGFLAAILGSRRRAKPIAALTAWWAPLLDGWLARRPAGYDAAAAVWLLGRRAEMASADREIMSAYAGAQG